MAQRRLFSIRLPLQCWERPSEKRWRSYLRLGVHDSSASDLNLRSTLGASTSRASGPVGLECDWQRGARPRGRRPGRHRLDPEAGTVSAPQADQHDPTSGFVEFRPVGPATRELYTTAHGTFFAWTRTNKIKLSDDLSKLDNLLVRYMDEELHDKGEGVAGAWLDQQTRLNDKLAGLAFVISYNLFTRSSDTLADSATGCGGSRCTRPSFIFWC